MIEDNEGDVELTKIAFEDVTMRNNFNVATNGLEGIHYLRKEGRYEHAKTPDFILLDLNMPKMGGKEFLSILKNDVSLKHMPVIIFTSSVARTDILDTYNQYANSYIPKPSTLEKYAEIAERIQDFWMDLAQLPEDEAYAAMH